MAVGSTSIYVSHQADSDPVTPTAKASQPWLHLSATSSTTPASLTVSAETLSLPSGRYPAAVTFSDVQHSR